MRSCSRWSAKNPTETEFHQAVREVAQSILPILDRYPQFRDVGIMQRMVEPERVIMFRVPWVDDAGQVQVNRGFRVEMSSAIGPYKGGLRFHPSVNLGMLKFLAFEQVFKNALTTLPMGGGKGGCGLRPQGQERHRGDALLPGVHDRSSSATSATAPTSRRATSASAAREIGFLFGQYKKLANEFSGVLTGKGLDWGGSLIRPEATGYGAVYFAEEMLKTRGESIRGKTCLVSGSGNVAQYTVENIIRLGGKAITLSDSGGFIHDPDGIDAEKLAWVMELKNVRRGRIREYADKFGCDYHDGKRPWGVPGAAVRLPQRHPERDRSATTPSQLTANGVYLVSEGANMPSEPEAVEHFLAESVLFGPGKAANAGGVATSGLEMGQNAGHTSWTRGRLDQRLLGIMVAIHKNCYETAAAHDAPGNYVVGANIAGFLKVAQAMIDQGVV